MTKEQKEEFLQYLENLKLIQADDFYCEGLDMAISALKGGWIPIEEREPDLMNEVLLSLRSLEVVKGWRSETLFHGERCYYICDSGDYAVSDNVLAWMPKPEPYKAEKVGE